MLQGTSVALQFPMNSSLRVPFTLMHADGMRAYLHQSFPLPHLIYPSISHRCSAGDNISLPEPSSPISSESSSCASLDVEACTKAQSGGSVVVRDDCSVLHNDLYCYDPETKCWKHLEPVGVAPEGRMNASAVVYGPTLLVHGYATGTCEVQGPYSTWGLYPGPHREGRWAMGVMGNCVFNNRCILSPTGVFCVASVPPEQPTSSGSAMPGLQWGTTGSCGGEVRVSFFWWG